MKQLVFTVYDRKAEVFGMPVFFRTVGEAERALSIQVTEPGSALSDFPADFDLWLIGSYDQTTGAITETGNPTLLGSVLDLVGDAADIKAVS